MAVFAIADTHLSRAANKPMDVFGPAWSGHPTRLLEEWRAAVAKDDIVLVAGDISWGMRLEEALPDLEDIDALPGAKVMIPGNHDYWWDKIGQLRKLPLPTLCFLQNDHVAIADGLAVCGARGWVLPGVFGWEEDPEHNRKIAEREVHRMRLSLESARKAGAGEIIAMTHFPPVGPDRKPTAMSELLASTPGVSLCVYGHLHGEHDHANAFQGPMGGVEYRLVAADYLAFKPLRLRE